LGENGNVLGMSSLIPSAPLTYCKIYTKLLFGNVTGNVPEKFSTFARWGVKILPENGILTNFFEKMESGKPGSESGLNILQGGCGFENVAI